jgi:glyoxylase-like metal-dependent hydrolase (beta-lactamase superfamily II)
MSDRETGEFFKRQAIGTIEVYSLIDGWVERPLRDGIVRNASVALVSAALRVAGLPDTVLRSPFTALAVVKNGSLTLIDAGTGGCPVYGANCGHLKRSLAAAGLDPANVRLILLTHLHGDHIYGLFDRHTFEPQFPNAQIMLPAVELRWWLQPTVEAMDLGPTREGLAWRIRATLGTWKNVQPFEAGSEIVPGVYPVPAYGHSPGHTAYLLKTGAKDLLVTGDVCINPALYFERPEWQPALDQDALMAVETRRAIFDRAAAEKLLVTGTHWHLPNVGSIARVGSGYTFEPLQL